MQYFSKVFTSVEKVSKHLFCSVNLQKITVKYPAFKVHYTLNNVFDCKYILTRQKFLIPVLCQFRKYI